MKHYEKVYALRMYHMHVYEWEINKINELVDTTLPRRHRSVHHNTHYAVIVNSENLKFRKY
jgi:hypothetical protein